MFNKKCSKCRKKVSKGYDFCPFCGDNFSSKYHKEDYGFLGKNDFIEENDPTFNQNSFIDKVFNTTLKMLEKQIRNLPKDLNREMNQPKYPEKLPSHLNVQFFINGKKVMPQRESQTNETKQKIIQQIPKEKIKKFLKLPKKEPISRIRRLSGKIIYELSLPGVKDIQDVLINQLENSIEIKAASKENLYLKTINLNLPIIRYKLDNENLILELEAK